MYTMVDFERIELSPAEIEQQRIVSESSARERIKSLILEAVQVRLDDFARTRNYDNIMSAGTYATDTDATFSADGQYCVASRGATWRKLSEILGEVTAGIRPEPTCYADIEPELPALNWPDWI